MRIESNRPLKTVAARRDEKAGNTGNSTFAEILAGDAAAPPAPAIPVGGIGGLLALQEVSDETARRRQASARGANILDCLDDLRLGLLTGQLSREKLRGLVAAIRSSRVTVADPQLQSVLDDIELRAEVELAKLEAAAV
jgi:hypothetical protein